MKNWKLLKKELVYNHPFRKIEEWTMLRHDGSTSPYSVDVTGDAVIVFGITDDKKVLLLEQIFLPTEKVHKTLVAGFLDEGKSPEEVAKKELREEAGCTAEEMISLGNALLGKWTNRYMHFFLAKGVKVVGDQELEMAEQIEYSFVDVAEMKELLKAGEIQDLTSEICARRALDYLDL